MPELPEVETTRRGLHAQLRGRRLMRLRVRNRQLRWPVPTNLPRRLRGLRLDGVDRRAKYLLLNFERTRVLAHLGMSGSMRICSPDQAVRKHDHLLFDFDDGRQLRFHDPRRFGCVLLCPATEPHPLLRQLGIEPLGNEFCGTYLHERARQTRRSIKDMLMDQRVVVGIGNIYAAEALFCSGIRPDRPAIGISRQRLERLAECIRSVLTEALDQGGTTLRDFVNGSGEPGYFSLHLNVYGRGGEPCPRCGRKLRATRLGQRSTVFCTRCQT